MGRERGRKRGRKGGKYESSVDRERGRVMRKREERRKKGEVDR